MEKTVLMKLNEEAHERSAESFLKGKYAPYLALLENSPLAKVRPHGITPQDYSTCGQMLQQFDEIYKPWARGEFGVNFNEADGSIAQLGVYPNIALDVIAVQYGMSPINVIASTQPIQEPHGTVYFKDFVAQNSRGNVTSGQKLFSTLGAPDVINDGFTGDTYQAVNPIVDPSPSTPAVYTNVALTSDDFGKPVNPQTMTIFGSAVCSAGTALYANIVPDPSTGKFSAVSQAGSSGTYLSLYGSVNFTNGTISANVSGATLTAVNLSAKFQTVEEANTDLQKAIISLQTKRIEAQFFALKSTWGMQEKYMLEKRFGMSLEESVATDLTAVINQEICTKAIKLIAANIPSGNQNTVFIRQPQSGVSLYEHKMAVVDAMEDADSQLLVSAGRGEVTCWIAGRKAASVLKTLPNFQKVDGGAKKFGPHILGTLEGVTVVRVPFDSVLDENTILGISRDENALEAPVVYSPYMPLVVTPPMNFGYNALQMQRACAVWAGIDTMVPNLSTQLEITQEDFNYGGAS